MPWLGGAILVEPAFSVPFVLGGTGSTSLSLTLPNDEAFVGANLNFQGIVLDPGASFGVAM